MIHWIHVHSASYQDEVNAQATRSEQMENATVFLGDSRVANLATSGVASNTENFGIAMDTIQDLTKRTSLYRLDGAKTIVLEIGVNDMAGIGPARFGEMYREYVKSLPKRVPIFALSILPVDSRFFRQPGRAESLRQLKEANAAIEEACVDARHCTYVDVNALLSGADGELRADYDVGDGMHLSRAGNLALAGFLRPIVSR